MDEEYRAPSSVAWVKLLISRIAWSLLSIIWELLIPVIQYSSLFVLMIIFSFLGYYLLNTTLLPQALMSEPLYFDFSKSPPMARLSMLSKEKQWDYTACLAATRKHSRGGDNTTNPYKDKIHDTDEINKIKDMIMNAARVDPMCSGRGKKRFLRAGFRYSIDVVFGLASSPKNLLMGKFMVYAKVVDSAGDSVATSSRPVVVPYQSHVTLVLDALVKYPLRAIGEAGCRLEKTVWRYEP